MSVTEPVIELTEVWAGYMEGVRAVGGNLLITVVCSNLGWGGDSEPGWGGCWGPQARVGCGGGGLVS